MMETGEAQGTEDLWDSNGGVQEMNSRQVETQDETRARKERETASRRGDPVTTGITET
jgi:hypothetical protein